MPFQNFEVKHHIVCREKVCYYNKRKFKRWWKTVDTNV